jgi:shikimate O-hydroxycinnamoyltransferase
LLQVELIRYRCGGRDQLHAFIYHHHVADDYSMNTFLRMWANAARAGKDFIVPAPLVRKLASTVIDPCRRPTPVFDHRSMEFKGE